MKQDTSYQSYEDICVNNMAVCAKRIKSSEVHEKSLNSQNYQSGLENTNLKKHKSCEKHSKKETSYVNISGENSKTTTCDSKLISTQLRRLENDLKLIFANKPVKKNMKLKSAPESNSTISTKRKFVKQSKPVKKSMELKSTQEICTESAKRKNSENKQKGKNTKLCCDIDDADTLILCIDEDEAFDILFGDLKSKVLKSFKAHEIKKCKEENT